MSSISSGSDSDSITDPLLYNRTSPEFKKAEQACGRYDDAAMTATIIFMAFIATAGLAIFAGKCTHAHSALTAFRVPVAFTGTAFAVMPVASHYFWSQMERALEKDKELNPEEVKILEKLMGAEVVSAASLAKTCPKMAASLVKYGEAKQYFPQIAYGMKDAAYRTFAADLNESELRPGALVKQLERVDLDYRRYANFCKKRSYWAEMVKFVQDHYENGEAALTVKQTRAMERIRLVEKAEGSQS